MTFNDLNQEQSYTLLIQLDKNTWIERAFHTCNQIVCGFAMTRGQLCTLQKNIYVYEVDKAHRCKAILHIYGISCQLLQQLDIDVSTWYNVTVFWMHCKLEMKSPENTRF